MDLIRFIQRRNEGFITCSKFANFMEHELLKRVHSDRNHGMGQTKFSNYCTDFSLNNNRLLVAHPNLQVSLYDVTKPIRSGYKCLNIWAIQSTLLAGLESINWNPDGGFFTFTAKDKHLICVDVEHMTEIERIKIEGAHRIFQHKPSPHNPEMVAVASPLSKVVLVDLKSGNLTCTAPFHPRGVLSVTWCGFNQNLLATAGDNGVIFWDVRQFRKPMYVNGDNCTHSGVLPNFEIIPFTDQLVLLNSDRSLTIWDAHKFEKMSYFYPFKKLPRERKIRYKFAISGTSEPGLIFMPENQDIGVYDFQSREMICALQLGHVMPIRALYFNNHRHQLFSSSLDGSLAWVPKPLLWGQCWENFIQNNE